MADVRRLLRRWQPTAPAELPTFEWGCISAVTPGHPLPPLVLFITQFPLKTDCHELLVLVWVSMKAQSERRTGGLLERGFQQRRGRQQRAGHRQGDKAQRRRITHIEMWAGGLDYSRTCLRGHPSRKDIPPGGPPSQRTPLPGDPPPSSRGGALLGSSSPVLADSSCGGAGGALVKAVRLRVCT